MDKVDCVVVGAGVIGLAVAARLARDGREVLLLEREDEFGTEASSRNSEVIHAGLYYPSDWLKTRLCVAGRPRLYEFCDAVSFTLRERGLRGRTVTVKARYWNFRTVTRSHTLPQATNLGPRLFATARDLLEKVPQGPLRLLGVSVSGLEDERSPRQGELFGEPLLAPEDERATRAQKGLDELRKKYGASVVKPGTAFEGRE